jgi:hypothetical protein
MKQFTYKTAGYYYNGSNNYRIRSFRGDWIRGIQFSDDDDKDGSRNVGLLTVVPTDVAASPRKFYWVK